MSVELYSDSFDSDVGHGPHLHLADMDCAKGSRDQAVEVTIPIPTAEELYYSYGGAEDGIDRQELEVLLQNLDGFNDFGDMPESKRLHVIKEYVDAQFEAADMNHDGVIDEDEFTLYYFQEICFKFPVGKNGFNPGAALYNIFANYCSFGKGGRRCEEMESHQLLRLAKECHLIDRTRCRQADIDLVFHRSRAACMAAKAKGAAKLQYRQFLHALMLVAEKRKSGFAEVVKRVKQYGINRREASMADFLIMSDPAGRYEDSRDLERPRGLPPLVRGNIGQTADVDKEQLKKSLSIEQQPAASAMLQGGGGALPLKVLDPGANRAADGMVKFGTMSLGKKNWDFQAQANSFYDENKCIHAFHEKAHANPMQLSMVLDDADAMWEARCAQEEKLTMALKYSFEQFNLYEGGVNRSRMDKMRFHKVMRDAKLLCSERLASGQVDKIYFRVKPEAQPTLNFVQFLEGLRMVAMNKRTSLNEVVERIVALGGPVRIAYK